MGIRFKHPPPMYWNNVNAAAELVRQHPHPDTKRLLTEAVDCWWDYCEFCLAEGNSRGATLWDGAATWK
jgi:hypothetical protein